MKKKLMSISWTLVRSVGNLRVLTRASYFMLLFVPILAGLWPLVASSIRAAKQLNGASENASITIQRLASDNPWIDENHELVDTGESAPKSLREKEEGAKPDASVGSDLRMPWSWGAVYLASLGVFLGQFFYQAFAPEAVAKFDLHSFVTHRRVDFMDAPTLGKVKIAIRYLPDVDEMLVDAKNLLENVEFVEQGAEIEYDNESQRYTVAIVSSLACYTIAIISLAAVVCSQSYAIFIAIF